MKIFVAHSSNFDFKNKLYAPLRGSALNSEHEILLPQEGPIEEITREMISGCDAVVAEVSAPSLGAGIEIGWADAASVPVIALYGKGAHPSFSIDNAVSDRFEYENASDMLQKLETALKKLR
jgi:nucleoside 2-deoxyribosyltransferase